VFFDEIDALVVSRGSSGSDSSVAERVLSQFLSEFDGIDELKGVLILGATNRLDMLDAAVLRPGRFDEIVEIPLPAEKDRMQIFGVHLRKKPIVDEIDPAELAKLTEGLSGAEIEAICNRAALMAVRKAITDAEGEPNSNTGVEIQAADMKMAMEEIVAKGKF
jgi:transitional endoplasmic reticulum ATPase